MCLLAWLGGCAHAPSVTVDWKGGPFFTPTNFHGVAQMPAEVRRVAVLPVAGMEALPPDTANAVEAAVRAALLAEGRFETVAVSKDLVQAAAGKPAVTPGEALPPALFERIEREYAVDAVLFVEITSYRPYTPLELGVRTKLARCAAPPVLLWTFDTLYNTREVAVANAARRHATGGRGAPVDPGPAALQSPSRFASYVFADVFATLPPRPVPLPPPAAPKVLHHRAD